MESPTTKTDMVEKVARARHAKVSPTSSAHNSQQRGTHAGVDRSASTRAAHPEETGLIPIIGSHVGIDRTAHHAQTDVNALDAQYGATNDSQHMAKDRPALDQAFETPDNTPLATLAERTADTHVADADEALIRKEETPLDTTASVGASAALISICTIISRITGFARTWAMAFALGATFISSSYQVANNLPNMLYELVMGGMLATAFLPVYLSIKKKQGKEVSEAYASNLLTIVVLGLGIVAALCTIFSAQVIFTQSFYSDQNEMNLSVFFFRFFAVQIVFYGASAIVSGLLNANRDYLWGAIAPVANNVIVIATFLMYAFVAPTNQQAAFLIIAIGNPLGVFVQMAIQLPALKRNGIRLKPRIDFKDPGLRETVSIGIPALFVTICSFVTVSVGNAASYSFAENGPSVIAYSRLWFTFPYSFLAIPVATAMFTELSDMQADGNTDGVLRGILSGSNQIFFLMIPCMFYLIVFASPLVTLYHMGAFTHESIDQIAQYLAVLALALPFYGVNTYLQMVFSSIRRMLAFSVITFVGSAAQVAIAMGGVWAANAGFSVGIEVIALGTLAAYGLGDLFLFIYLRMRYTDFRLMPLVVACLRGIGFGALGALVGWLVLTGLQTFVGPLSGSILQAFLYIVIAGLAAVLATFAPAIAFHIPEAEFASSLVGKIARKLHR